MSKRTRKVIYKTEGQVIKKLRTENDLSMRELGQKIGLSDSSVSQWENGRLDPTAQNIEKICEVFGIGEKYFFEMCREYQKNESDYDFIKTTIHKLDPASVKMLRTIIEANLAKG